MISPRRSRVLYLPRDPTLSAVFFCTSQVGGALTHLLFLCGRIICSDKTLSVMLLAKLYVYIVLLVMHI